MNSMQQVFTFGGALEGWMITGLRALLILLVAGILNVIAQRAIRGLRERVASRLGDGDAVSRATTLGRVARYLAGVLIFLAAVILVLSELGISVAPMLGAAGVVGVALGFGAQSLVKDYFNGFFLLLEDQLRQGEVVKLADHGGLVEEVTLRYVRLRDYDGNVHFVPNGEIRTVVNLSREHAQAVIDVGIAYKEDIDRVTAVMRSVAEGLRGDPDFAARILDPLELAGVERWDDSAVIIRYRFRVAPLEQWSVRREFLRRLKYAFDANGIEIPFPQRTVHVAARTRAAAHDAPVA